MARELKKLKISRISIVASGANRERFMIRKSVDLDDEERNIADFFPLMIPRHLTKRWKKEEKKIALAKAAYEAKKTSPDDLFPSILLPVTKGQLDKMIEDDDDED